jgi:peptidoglycan/xylan/chitin deacetylase (PgdA/CDA1 family)
LIAVLGILPVRAAKAAETSGVLQEAYAFPYGATATVAAWVSSDERTEWSVLTEDRTELCRMTVGAGNPRIANFSFTVPETFARCTALYLYRADRKEPQAKTLLFCDIPQNNAVWQVACSEKMLAITFDAANAEGNTREIMDILERYNAKATFFVIGRFAENHPELCAELIARGHELASHSYDHPDMLTINEQEAYRNLLRTDELIRGYNGNRRVLYRPQSGQSTFRDRAIARGLDSEVIRWSVDSGDGFRIRRITA